MWLSITQDYGAYRAHVRLGDTDHIPCVHRILRPSATSPIHGALTGAPRVLRPPATGFENEGRGWVLRVPATTHIGCGGDDAIPCHRVGNGFCEQELPAVAAEAIPFPDFRQDGEEPRAAHAYAHVQLSVTRCGFSVSAIRKLLKYRDTFGRITVSVHKKRKMRTQTLLREKSHHNQ